MSIFERLVPSGTSLIPYTVEKPTELAIGIYFFTEADYFATLLLYIWKQADLEAGPTVSTTSPLSLHSA